MPISRSEAGELLRRAKEGTLGPGEADRIAEELARPPESRDADPHTLLSALGRASNHTAHGELVERYIGFRDDPFVAALALRIVCLWWSQTARWLDTVTEALYGQEWDTDEDVRLAACGIAGEYLRHHENAELLRALILVSEDERALSGTRGQARDGLGRALGFSHNDLIAAPRSETDFWRRVAEDAKARLARA